MELVRRTAGLAALAVLLIAATPRPGAAQIDASGPWGVQLGFPFGIVVMTFTEVGTALIVAGLPGNGDMQGSIDPGTGAFSVAGGSYCSSSMTGTVTATGTRFTATVFYGAFDGIRCRQVPMGADGRRCGNGVLEPGEVCDDGNFSDGDCCAGDCQAMLPVGTACDDGNSCTTNACSAAGRCEVLAVADNGAPCDDGSFCDGTDTCFAGQCVVHSGNPCPQDISHCTRICDDTLRMCVDSVNSICSVDGNPCRRDHCDGNGSCVMGVNLPAGTACPDDGVGCTLDVCNAGTCTHPNAPAGTACPDDGLICTLDLCNAGTCTHPPAAAGTSCGTAAGPCSAPRVCDGTGGVCPGGQLPAGTRGPGCAACESCDPSGACVAAPQTAPMCRDSTPGGSRLEFVQGKTDARDTAHWMWRGNAALADFGAPELSDDYALCVYTLAGMPTRLLAAHAPAGGICGRRACWRRAPGSRLTYRDPALTPDGISSMVLQTGKITLRGKGAALGLPSLPATLPLLVQLQDENGGCWQAQYSGARTNDGRRLKASSG